MLLHVKYLLIFLFAVPLFPQTISQIEITGNKEFSISEYLSWISVNKGSLYYEGILDSIKYRAARNLAAKGFYSADFDKSNIEINEDSSQINIIFNVVEKSPTLINEIIVEEGDSLLTNTSRRNLDLLKNSIFIKNGIERIIEDLIDYNEDKGLPFLKVEILNVHFFNDTISNSEKVNVNIRISPGALSVIDTIEIKGNTKTKDYVILRELRIKNGELYSQSRLEDIPKKLNRLRFFEPVRNPEFYFNSKNEGVLIINIKEKQTNNFDGIIGYIPGTGDNEKGYITGLINISLRNIFGTGRAAAIRWQQIDRFSQELEIKYLEPWIMNLPFNINGGMFQRKQDTTYVQRKFDGSIEFLATDEISASILFGTEQIIPTESEIPRFTVYNSSSLTTGVSLKIDSRDDPYAPSEGILFNNIYSFIRKKINGPAQFITSALETNLTLQRFEVDFNIFYEMFFRQIVALGVHGKELQANSFEVSDLFRLGGTNTLRGYRENQFLGSRILWTNLEYRLLLTPRSYAFLFFDTGYYLRKEDEVRQIDRTSAFKYGYGLGISIETGLGLLGVSFALGEGDAFSDGKIHFGIINEF